MMSHRRLLLYLASTALALTAIFFQRSFMSAWPMIAFSIGLNPFSSELAWKDRPLWLRTASVLRWVGIVTLLALAFRISRVSH